MASSILVSEGAEPPEALMTATNAQPNGTTENHSGTEDHLNGVTEPHTDREATTSYHTNGHRTTSSPPPLKSTSVENLRRLRVVVIGAGFSGIYLGIRIPEWLRNVDLCIYEKNDGLGGTWWENKYPGCACDIPAHSYVYSFAPNRDWSRFYASSGEIQTYLESTARKYSADRFIKCGHRVKRCVWDVGKGKWRVTVEETATGKIIEDKADVVVSARGILNDYAWPKIDGLWEFQGKVVHSAAWDESYGYSNKRIGVIGSGSSAIQIVPQLQKLDGVRLSCFVRGKTWIAQPFGESAMEKLHMDHQQFTPEDRERYISDPRKYLDFRKLILADSHKVHGGTVRGSTMSEGARVAFTKLMRERLAKKPELAEQLLPAFSVGCRRLTPGPGYLEALTEDNVDFISTPIKRITSTGIELTDGRPIELDVIVCATGFDAAAAPPFPVVGLDNKTLKSRFSPYPEAYLSLAVDSFPNFFLMMGPNSAIGAGSLVRMIESFGNYIIKCVRKLQKEDIRSMVVKSKRVEDFAEYCRAYFPGTVYLDQCKSWYRGEGGNGDRIVGLWPGSTLHCMETLRSPRWEDFEYEYDEEDAEGGKKKSKNQLWWLGDGWSVIQRDGGDATYYIEPEFLDIPSAPLPEETPIFAKCSFSH